MNRHDGRQQGQVQQGRVSRRSTISLISAVLVVSYALFSNLRFLSKFHQDVSLGLKPVSVGLSFLNTTSTSTTIASPANASSSTSVFALQDPATSPHFAIFYNVYIPADKRNFEIEQSLAVVDEQMQQVGDSFAASYKNKPVNVFYNTIGRPGVLNNTYMANVCSHRSNMRCIHMDHHDKGFEEVTLQRLYDYCQLQTDPNSKVVYLHNKGSYHAYEKNHWWRRHMTTAVTSEMCLKPERWNLTCSTCGLVYFGVWSLMYPGNEFVAECSYIRKLIPPDRFTTRLEEVFELRKQKNKENPQFKIISPNFTSLHDFGSGRFGNEAWVTSHPSMIPCDLTGERLSYWTDHGAQDSAGLSLAHFPRPPMKLETLYMLAGNLFKYFALYNEAPPDDSWMWSSFPDGEKWRQAVKTHGARAVDILMEEKMQTELNQTSRTSP